MDAQTDNSTATVDDRRHRIRELKARKLENQLALEVAQQEQALTALSYAGMSAPVRVARQRARRESAEAMEDTGLFNPDVVTPSDYMGEPGYSGYGGAVGQAGWLSTRSDREDGRNRPVFATENELGMIRGAARLLATYNPNAVGILGHLKNYAVGEGCVYRFSMFDSKSDQTLAKACQKVVDRFIEDNAFVGDYDSELFGRSCRDGEYFFGLWHQGHGRVEGRAIEPEQITEPSTPRDIEEWLDQTAGLDSWWGGVHSDADDTESIHGVYAQWSNNSQDWDYLPAGRKPCSPPSGNNAWVEHFKTDNVDRKIKRGLSDFFCAGMLDKARKLLRNMGDGASVQSAIAWIVETAAGTLPTTVQSLTLNQSAGQYQQSIQQGTRVNQIGKYDPATIVYTANGTVYKPAPMGSTNAPNFVVVYEAMMRSLAVRWQMPEHFVTGSAANNDYASILEAGSPSEKAMRRRQAGIAGSHARIMWKVVEFACNCGEIPCDFVTLRTLVRLSVKPPRVAVRDRLKEVQADQVMVNAGAMSPATMSANDGLDYQEQIDEGAEPHEVKAKTAEMPVDPQAKAAAAAGAAAAGVDSTTTTESANDRVNRVYAAWRGYP